MHADQTARAASETISVSIDPALRELTRGGETIPVEPMVFDLIVHLVAHSDRVVSKDELVDAIWQGRAISDATLSGSIKSARRALGDDGQAQTMIRTFHRRGFRFVGEAELIVPREHVAPAAAPASPEPPARIAEEPSRPVADDTLPDLTLPKKPSVAVLPFEVIGDTALHPVIADGLSRDITVRLSRTRWLFVTARASARQFHMAGQDPVEIGAKLGVRYLVHGALLVSDGRLRLTVTLTDAIEEGQVWAERFDRRLDDVFEIQEEIADLIVSAVESEIELKERRRSLLKPIASLDAWSAYHRARNHLFRFRAEDYDHAETLLNQAMRLDPNSSRIFASLSFLHWQRAFLDISPDRRGEFNRAFDYARQSVSLDPLDPQGHWVLGRAHILDGDFDSAAAELQTAVDLNPNFAQAQYSRAFGMMFEGPVERGLEFIDQARRISPYDPMTFAFFGQRAQMLAFLGDTAAAALWIDRALRQPNVHHHIFAIAAWIHELAGEHDVALACIRRLLEQRPGYTTADYFRAFPFTGERRVMIERMFRALGLAASPAAA